MAKETTTKKYKSNISNLYLLDLDVKFQNGIFITDDPKLQKVLDKKKGITMIEIDKAEDESNE